MPFELWCIVVGALLTGFALMTPRIDRVPITTSLLYLAAGVVLGPLALDALHVSVVDEPLLLERLSEAAVVIAVFSSGLKLRVSLRDRRWSKPLLLAFVAMPITVALVAVAGVYGLGLSWGAAILFGAILAPTDPVLASEVEVRHSADRDPLRFSLTGEAAFNDGTAFPFVMLGLGLLGLHDLGSFGWRWVAVDVLWAIVGGLGIGVGMGWLGGRAIRAIQKRHHEEAIVDDFLAIGLVVVTYGLALVCHTYGFLAAAALGLGLRRGEDPSTVTKSDDAEVAETPEEPPEPPDEPPITYSVLSFTEQLMRFGELGMVLLVGAMLTWDGFELRWLWFVPVLFFVIRPISVHLGLIPTRRHMLRRNLISWFGIRGIGSIYYLSYAIGHGVDRATATTLAGLTLMTMVASVVVHGLSVTPLIAYYEKHKRAKGQT